MVAYDKYCILSSNSTVPELIKNAIAASIKSKKKTSNIPTQPLF